MKKKLLSVMLSTAMVAALLAGCTGNTPAVTSEVAPTTSEVVPVATSEIEPGSVGGSEDVVLEDTGDKLTIECWNDEWQTRVINLMPGYTQDSENDPNHGHIGDLPVEWIVTPSDNGAYQNALDADLLDDAADVDIFLVEADYAGKYTVPGVAKALGDLGITDADIADQYAYTQQVVTTDGVLYGSSWQTCGAGMIYNRDIAKEVLGTDDPDEVQALVSDWDKWQDVAGQMKEAGYKMTPCAATSYRVFSNNVTTPWVKDGKINVDANIQKWIDMSKEMVDAEQTGTFGLWDTNEDFQKNISFCVFGPAWYFDFCMQKGSGDSIADRGGWALCQGPQAHYWGGTWVCVADKTDNAKTAADILKTMTMDEGVLTSIIEDYGDNVNNKTIVAKYAADTTYGNDVLGGQNPYSIFEGALANVDVSNMTIYDQICNEAIQTAMTDYFTGKVDEDTAWDNFYTQVEETYPELSR